MTNAAMGRYVAVLRWTLGVVVFVESLRLAFSAEAAHFFLKIGLPAWVRPALGLTEAAAALLFVVPFSRRLGSYVLLVIFALAALLHVLHGQYDVGGLAVYAAAVLVCMAHSSGAPAEIAHER